MVIAVEFELDVFVVVDVDVDVILHEMRRFGRCMLMVVC